MGVFEILYALAAVATIAGFAFDVWVEYKRADGVGKRLRGQKPERKKDRR